MRPHFRVSFDVPGRPVGWQRAGRNGQRYFTRPQTARYEADIRACFLAAASDASPDLRRDCLESDYVSVEIMAWFHPPRSWSGKKRAEASLKPYTQKPDADNISKAVLDALNGIAWTDDKKVYDLQIVKRYNDYVEGITVNINFFHMV